MKQFYNGYELTSWWFNFVSENSDKVECKHTALYLYIVEMFNKRNWVETIGLPTDFTMGVLNISSYKTYSNTLNDLIEFGFIKLVEKSKNQHTSNKVALVKNAKASSSHIPKQIESNDQSKLSITKLLNKETIKLINDNYKLVNLHLRDWINSVEKEDIPAEEKKLEFGSLGNEFVANWKEWVDFRIKLKKKFVDIDAQQKAVNQLIKLSEGNKLVAVEIINKSIANSWQGLFKLPLHEMPKTKSVYEQKAVH